METPVNCRNHAKHHSKIPLPSSGYSCQTSPRDPPREHRGNPTFSPLAVHTTGRVSNRPLADEGVLSGALTRYGRFVLWLGRPPYLRWSAAAILLVAAVVWDLSERATEPFPFAATDLSRGQPIEPDDIQWRDVPVGSMTRPQLGDPVAAVAIAEGDPIVRSLLAVAVAPPLNGWAVPIPLPVGAVAGTPVSLVFADGTDVEGTIIRSATEDSLGFKTDGLVMVEDGDANAVALAAANGDLVVLIRP